MQVRTAFPWVTRPPPRTTVIPMKMSNDLEKKFQDQITLEFAASITYRQLAIEADEQDLPGIAAWLRHQADEEIVHANKFIQHVSDRGNHAAIGALPAPGVAPGLTVLEIFEAALAHEEKVSVSESIGRGKLVGEDGSGLLRLDAELGRRPAESTEADEG